MSPLNRVPRTVGRTMQQKQMKVFQNRVVVVEMEKSVINHICEIRDKGSQVRLLVSGLHN